jgi:multiple antibiotic resistance protein
LERDVVQYGELETFAVGLLAMINPIGGAAIFAAMAENLSSSERAAMAHTASVAVATLLLVTAWVGKPLLGLLSIGLPAFEVAGGLIVLRIALGMLQRGAAGFAAPPDVAAGKGAGQAVLGMAVVPLAMPMLVGPGAMATVIIQTHKQPGYTDALAVSAVCLGMALVVWACLQLAAPMCRLLGAGGVDVLTRILGLLLAAIAIGMIASGLGGLFPRLV